MSKNIKSFLSIDFETANPNRVSACALGLVKVVDGEIVSERSYLIKPVGGYSRFNTAVHGITEEKTRDAPTFDKIFDELKDDFERFPVVSYTAFDQSVLVSLIDYYNIHLDGDVMFVDVYDIAKNLVPGLPNYKLPTVAYHLQIPYATHHDAACDAAQCAKIYLKLSDKVGLYSNPNRTDIVESFVGLIEDVIADGVIETREAYELQNFLCCVSGRGKIFKAVFELVNEVLEDGVVEKMESDLLIAVLKYALVKLRDYHPSSECVKCVCDVMPEAVVEVQSVPCPVTVPEGFVPKVNPDIPLKYKERWEYVKEHPFVSLTSANVVMTEDGVMINRGDAETLIEALGGKLKASTTRDTDFCVVLGRPVECCTTSKVRKAQELQGQGSPIRIISEDEFIALAKSTL